MSADALVRGPAITIASSASLSSAINLSEFGLVALLMPSVWTTANLTFQASDDEGGAYRDVYDSAGTELTVTAAASRHIVLSPLAFAGLRFIKVRSGTSGSPVTQVSARTIIPLVRKIA